MEIKNESNIFVAEIKKRKIMRTKVQEIRKQAIDSIKSSIGLLSCLEMVDIDEGNSPIVNEDRYDENLTTTLDRIEQDENRNLTFYHSSACNNGWLREDEIPTDALIDIAEFLEEHKEQIQEIINETDTTADDDNMPRDMFVKDTYDSVCRALTDYEHPQDCGCTEAEAANELYDVLVKIQNNWDKLTNNE